MKSWIEKFKVEALTGPIAYRNHFTTKVPELIKLKELHLCEIRKPLPFTFKGWGLQNDSAASSGQTHVFQFFVYKLTDSYSGKRSIEDVVLNECMRIGKVTPR